MTNTSREEDKEIARVLKQQFGFGGEGAGDDRAGRLDELHQRAQGAMKQADKAARVGKMAEAKRWIDVAQQMVAAARRVEELGRVVVSEGEENRRAELRERLARYATQSRDLARWKMRAEIWAEMAAEAERTGAPMPAPMPPRPAHWSDQLNEEGLRQRIRDEV